MPAVASRGEPDTLKWISAAAAGVLLGTYPRQVKNLAARGLIRTLALPGIQTKYCYQDVRGLQSAPDTTTAEPTMR